MKKIITGCMLGMLMQFATAETIPVINDLKGSIDPGAVGYAASLPYICVRKTTEGEKEGPTEFVIKPDGKEVILSGGHNQYWYDASVRLNGCRDKDEVDPVTKKRIKADPYVGYLGIGKQDGRPEIPLKNNLSFSPSDRMTIENPQKFGHTNKITGTLTYVAIPENLKGTGLKPLVKNRKLTYVGINLSGGEFGKAISANSVPDLSDGTKPGPDLKNMQTYIAAGINTVRVPIHWGYLELLKEPSTIDRPEWIWNEAYWKKLIAPTLATLTNAGIYTIIDLHSYLHYSTFGAEVAGCLDEVPKCPDGTKDINPAHYIKAWNDILTGVRKPGSNIIEKYLMFDLVNEPAGNQKNGYAEVVSPQDAFNVQIQVARAIQAQVPEFQGKILLEGASWTGLHSWKEKIKGADTTNDVAFSRKNLEQAGIKFNKNSNNVLINVHQYFDDDFSGTQDVCLKDLNSVGKEGKKFNTAEFAKWLKDENLKAIVTEFGASNNKEKKSEESCKPILNEFVQYLIANAVKENEAAGGFLGATLWATGHDWGDYNLLFGPDTYQFKTFINNTVGK